MTGDEISVMRGFSVFQNMFRSISMIVRRMCLIF